MKAFFLFYKSSRIVKGIVNRIVIIELICFLAFLSLMVFFLQPLLNKQSAYMASDINTYISSTVNATFESMVTESQNIASSGELYRAIEQYYDEKSDQAYRNVRITLNRLVSGQPYLRGAILDNTVGIRFDSVTNLTADDQKALNGDWYQSLGDTDYGQRFYVLQENTVSFLYANTVYFGPDRYIITLFFNADPLINNIKKYSKNIFSGFALVNRSQEIVYLDGELEVFQEFLPKVLSGRIVSFKEGVFFVNSIQSNMWELVSYAEYTDLSTRYNTYLLMMVLSFVLLFILTVLILTPAVYKRIAPINTLSSVMERIVQGDLRPAPEIESNDEIGDLSRIFNHMINSLNDHIHTILKQEKDQQKMRYSLLISQINPHFIYNTMNIINIMAREKRYDDIIDINTALIEILKDKLRMNDIQVFDSVEKEVAIVNKYMMIQKLRYRNNVAITWKINEALKKMLIPKNLIQPLVENALFHGLIDEGTGELRGSLRIEIAVENDVFIIRVSDSGKGIEPERIQEIMEGFENSRGNRGRHIGLRNIYDRLKYLYNDSFRFHIDGNGGTTVTIGILWESIKEELQDRS